MPRQLRIQYPGALYHVMSRGNRWAAISLDDVGELRRETAEAKGQRIIAEELGRLGWQEADPVSRRKSDPAKLQMAARLRKETTLSIRQIAGRLHLGTPRSASAGLHSVRRATAPTGSLQGCLAI
jgi:hypothetical protein